jgi:FG-GAP-like repeat/RTX calcium-binding nonapeptide repeat (4 copies)
MINDLAGQESHIMTDIIVNPGGSIQAAIDAANDGDRIVLVAGTFVGDVTVNKAVTIVGANQGIDGTGVRGPESIIEGTVTVTQATGTVAFDGVQVSNTSNNLTQFNGIVVSGGADVTVENSQFFSTGPNGNNSDRAIFLQSGATGTILIDGNFFGGVQDGPGNMFSTANWATGVWSDGFSAGLTITGNTFDSVRTGINLDGYDDATTNVSANSFVESGSGIAIATPSGSAVTGIHDNTFSGASTDFNLENVTTSQSLDLGATNNVSVTPDDAMVVLGGTANDTLTGSDGIDLLGGGDGDDTLLGGVDNDILIGGSDFDQAVFSGARADYQVDDLRHSVQVVDLRSGTPDGTDTLIGIEQLVFADGVFAIGDVLNDPPSVTAPLALPAVAGQPTTITGVTFADSDGGTGEEVATFAADVGVLAAVAGGGVAVTGSGTSTVTLTGSLANLNAFIAAGNLTYTGSEGTHNVHVTINDQGNTGGGALTDAADIQLSVASQNNVNTPPTKGDFDGDHQGDLFLFTDTGQAAIWLMDEGVRKGSGANLPDNGPTWHAKEFVDFDPTGGLSDILWQNDNGALSIWQMNGTNIVAETNIANPGAANHVADAADFNGDGTADILLQNTNGSLSLLLMQDSAHVGSQVTIGQNPGAGWHIVAGDFNGDGKAGLLFSASDGSTAVWDGLVQNGTQGEFSQQTNLSNISASGHVIATGDFDGDHKDDVVIQNDSGAATIWLMDGLQIKSADTIAGTQANGPTWHIVAARDMNGDDKADLLFQNDNGATALWENFHHAAAGAGSFDTQVNISPQINSGQLDWHVL